MTKHRCMPWVHVLLLFVLSAFCCAKSDEFTYFDTEDVGEPDSNVPLITPWKIVVLDPEYAGQWMVAADVDADGEVEIVSAENVNEGDVHYTSTAVAQKLDGSVLWQWGDPDVGRKNWHHDVACQVHDWNGDGRNVVVLFTKGFIVELDGATGRELRRIPIAEDATDCLLFCNLSGGDNSTDILVDIDHRPYGKSPIWVLDEEGGLLGQMVTDYSRHHCLLDWTGDGVDEILVAHKGGLYNDRGKRIGTFHTPGVDASETGTKYEKSMLIGDMTADGIPDVVIATPHAVYIYRNTQGRRPDRPVPLGTEFNFTLY